MKLFDKLLGAGSGAGAGQRALEDRSTVELAGRMKHLGKDRPREFPLRASAYLYKSRIIVCRRTGYGLVAEVGEPVVLDAGVDDETLGRTICDQLLAYSTATPKVADQKESAWPAFSASGARSLSQFRRDGWYVDIAAPTGFLIEMKVSAMQSLHQEIEVAGSANSRHDEIGAAFRRAARGIVALRAAGIL